MSLNLFARRFVSAGSARAAVAALSAALAVAACGETATTTPGTGAATDTSGGSDTAVADSGGAKDGSPADGTASDGKGDTSSADSGGGADVAKQDTGVTPDQIAAQLKAAQKAEADFYLALCKVNFTCETGIYFTDAPGCAADLAASGGLAMFADGIAAVKAGRASVDAAMATACMATLDASCTFFKALTLPEACHKMFTGKVDASFQCAADVECKSGYCKFNDANDPACTGVCTEAKTAGAACDSDSACQFPLWCIDGKCAAAKYAAKGESCSELPCSADLLCMEGGDDFSCSDAIKAGQACGVGEGTCATGLYCAAKAADDSDGVCTASVALGKPCDRDLWYEGATDSPCAKGSVCVPLAADATAATCQAYAAVGKPCVTGDQCQGWDEGCFTMDDDSTQCQYLPELGEACEPLSPDEIDYGLRACLPPYACDAKTSKCVALPAAGKPCVEMRCAADLWCDGDWDAGTGTCATFGQNGEACQSFVDGSSTCDSGLMCGAKSETCVAPVCK